MKVPRPTISRRFWGMVRAVSIALFLTICYQHASQSQPSYRTAQPQAAATGGRWIDTADFMQRVRAIDPSATARARGGVLTVEALGQTIVISSPAQSIILGGQTQPFRNPVSGSRSERVSRDAAQAVVDYLKTTASAPGTAAPPAASSQPSGMPVPQRGGFAQSQRSGFQRRPAAPSDYMVQQYESATTKTADGFLDAFPYSEYLNKIKFTDLDTLQADRLYLWNKLGDGDAFLYRLGEAFITRYPVAKDQVEPKIDIAEVFLNARGRGINDSNSDVYRAIGYFILNKVAQELNSEIAQKKFDPDTPHNKQIVQRLSRNKVYLAVEESTGKKLWSNVTQGNFSYIWSRVASKVSSTPQSVTALQAKTYKSYLPVASGDYAYQIFSLSESGSPLGHAVYMKRPNLQAEYFATDPAAQLQQLRNRGDVVVATTAGFTNNYSKPEGFTSEDGKIVNAVIMPDRHGLVLVENSGGIRVIDLKRDEVKLPRRSGMLTIKNPTQSLVGYSQLLDWCRTERATAFQTQLMAYGDAMLIEASKASTKIAERRMLAIASKDATVYHVLFNIPQQKPLYELSQELFDLLHKQKYKVEALLNLDTGGQNVLYVYDDKGNVIADIAGTRSAQETTNLLVYKKQ